MRCPICIYEGAPSCPAPWHGWIASVTLGLLCGAVVVLVTVLLVALVGGR
jgi:hypothetical protein